MAALSRPCFTSVKPCPASRNSKTAPRPFWSDVTLNMSRAMEDEINSAVADSPGAGADAAEAPIGQPGTEDFAAERERLTRQAAELQDQILRSRADFENYRKRRDREQ